ncbi:Eukaryotic aspartyl protease family protein [Raphanus sativus]|uniref:Aspartyl protease family protein 1 n=1 Tax=Raphanus sativus TaxID=3726 RepID=A0A6J0JN79_RAPSA|nr:aspartyl protease family protein 1 [Raphanus sativus]KAJ4890168.1 Eukaryotic aspartyl protease family protein [Raphanus sativus]
MALASHAFVVLSALVLLSWGLERCEATGKFSFEVHHMFSDAVKQNLGFDNLVPEEGSLEYFKVLAQRDRLTRGRGLASNNEHSPLTSAEGNLTVFVNFLGSLHYANVSVGTPATWFLVALDTGSDLFWLPCNCGVTCISDLKDAGFPASVPLNLYSPNTSSTSSSISCSDDRCFESSRCSSPSSVCPYQVSESTTTTSTGTLLQDVFHLITEDADLKPVEANVTLGCGQRQTGLFQNSQAVNGVLGLGVKDYSLPSLLAKAKLAANSFSICFGRVIGVVGRISFGDKGYTDQSETPFVSIEPSTAYGVNVTGLSVGKTPVGLSMFAQFDTGSSYTHLKEPAYGLFTKAFNSRAFDIRRPSDPQFPFEFCYDLSPNATNITFPPIDMTFEGGSVMRIKNPFVTIQTEGGGKMYCLSILKIEDLRPNIIGQNLMSGYRIVFDRERMVLGWKRSNCFEDESLTSTPPADFGNPSPPQPESEAPSPSIESNPLLRSPPPPLVFTTTPPPTNPRDSAESPGSSGAANVIPLASQLLLLLSLLAYFF